MGNGDETRDEGLGGKGNERGLGNRDCIQNRNQRRMRTRIGLHSSICDDRSLKQGTVNRQRTRLPLPPSRQILLEGKGRQRNRERREGIEKAKKCFFFFEIEQIQSAMMTNRGSAGMGIHLSVLRNADADKQVCALLLTS